MKNILQHKALKVLTYLSIVITPIVAALIWLGIFVVANFITSVWKQKKDGTLNSHQVGKMLSSLITSICIYFIFCIVARGFDLIVLPGDPLPFTASQIAIGLCALREFKPITENVGAILGLDIWSYFKEKIKLNAK